ncbi:LysR family transcriptional regulator [Pseudoflavonifractor phocaeensis]|uniref:helix-turn-helix domain-containing protein n=1 Tax=Pseudoflavonifractor phocaeensis TaxID=1870988 RepID=UPI002FF6B61B
MLNMAWNTLFVICETMNYTRVAEQLCLTRPAVSHHIHRLEDRYGRRLFSYRGKALRLTETGIHPFFALQ